MPSKEKKLPLPANTFPFTRQPDQISMGLKEGDWCVDGTWIALAEFERRYGPAPNPEPVAEVLPPVPEAPPPQEPAEAPVAPEPAPVVEEPLPLAIGPSALDVDQGSMSHNQETP